ncbi:hypothetical protein [Micromonospora costi]|uniref:8-oxoguanine DNA glycosylase OGG fold protein n=1 Tax=Micromonospora costi TaxID=1530042 RepID=UPI0030C7FB46
MTATCSPFDDEPPTRERYVLDHGFSFNPTTWRRRLPAPIDLPTFLSGLPLNGPWPRISRGDLLRAGAEAHTGRAARDILIAAYVWGHGLPSRRGPARLQRVLDLNGGDTDRWLGEAVSILRSEGPRAAYEALDHGGRCKLKRLGPSFFTKLLYFLGWNSCSGRQRPLILDRYVVIGLKRCGSVDWPEFGPWTADQYAEYLAWAREKASQWGVETEADVVERRLWEYGKCLAAYR